VLVGNASIVVLMVVTVYLHAGIPWQDIVSLLSISPWISCLGQASFFKIYLNRGSQLIDAVVIFGWGSGDWAGVERPGERSSFKACGPITLLS
jgi:hypothetical protein